MHPARASTARRRERREELLRDATGVGVTGTGAVSRPADAIMCDAEALS